MERSSRALVILTVIAGLLILLSAYMALGVAPDAIGLTEDNTYAQRIIYFHVPSRG
jgi:hypothetical protein